jgi:hypothetical protein
MGAFGEVLPALGVHGDDGADAEDPGDLTSCRSELRRCSSHGIWWPRGALGRCPGDRLNGLSGDAETALGPAGAPAPADGQGRRTPAAPARERGAAQATQSPGNVRAGRPAVVRSAVCGVTPASLGARVPSDAADRALLAPQAHRAQVGLQRARAPDQTGQAAEQEGDPGLCGWHAGAAAESRASSRGWHIRSAPPPLWNSAFVPACRPNGRPQHAESPAARSDGATFMQGWRHGRASPEVSRGTGGRGPCRCRFRRRRTAWSCSRR